MSHDGSGKCRWGTRLHAEHVLAHALERLGLALEAGDALVVEGSLAEGEGSVRHLARCT